MDPDDFGGSRFLTPAAVIAALAVVAAIGAGFFAVATAQQRDTQLAALRADVSRLEADLRDVRGSATDLTGRLKTTEKKLKQKTESGRALAARALRSVFTVHTSTGFGSGFAAGRSGGKLYVVTADHVIADGRVAAVTLSRRDGSWSGEIVKRDPANDLALVRLDARPQGAEPLWQRPLRTKARAGDQLLLVGSPYGLEGTVTTGIVSRVTARAVQTDAAANPGNSGGPALDAKGRVVGVLVAGGAQNLNFAVPIGRVCIRLRSC
jgi:S1-C subfamily serine protease